MQVKRPLLSKAITICGQFGAIVLVSWASRAQSCPWRVPLHRTAWEHVWNLNLTRWQMRTALLMISEQRSSSLRGTAVNVRMMQRMAAKVIRFRTSPRSCVPTSSCGGRSQSSHLLSLLRATPIGQRQQQPQQRRAVPRPGSIPQQGPKALPQITCRDLCRELCLPPAS